MNIKRLKITRETTRQVRSDYWRAERQFSAMQTALQEDLVEKLSENIGMTFADYDGHHDHDDEPARYYQLSTVDAMVTKGNTFVQLYFVTDDMASAKEQALWLSPQDLHMLRLFKRGEVSARELFNKLETDDFDLFVRRFTMTLEMEQVIDIYNSSEAFIEKTENGFTVE